MTSKFSDLVSLSFFLSCFDSLVKFSYWSKFQVNIFTSSGVTTISFYMGLTRNPEIGNTPVWVFHNIWRLGQVRNTKFGTNVSNMMLLNAAKCQGFNVMMLWCYFNAATFTVPMLLRGNQQGGTTPLPTQLLIYCQIYP